MKLGVSSYAFGWNVGVPPRIPENPFTELDLVSFARRQRLSVAQIGDHIPLSSFDAEGLLRLRDHARASESPVELEIGGRGMTRANLARYLKIARFLNSPLVRFVIDAAGHEPEPEEVISIIREAVPQLREENVLLGIENHDRFSAATLRAIIEAIGSDHVGICLDTANSLGAGEGIQSVVEQLGRYTVNLHVKDFAITRVPHAMGFMVEGRIAGQGMLDLTWLRDSFATNGRCRSAILETWTPPENDFAQTLAKEKTWAEESIVSLKKIFPT